MRKKYFSCTAPVGEYCSKHGVIHKKTLTIKFFIFGIIGCFLFFAGIFLMAWAQTKLMGGYDLYNCLVNNAGENDFPTSPVMKEKIEQECICFKQKDWNSTRILEEGCP